MSTDAPQEPQDKAELEELTRLTAAALGDTVVPGTVRVGLDVPRLTAVVLAAPARAEGRTEQRLGRAMRPAPGKPTPRLYDVVDEQIGIFRSQYRSRIKAYRKVLGEGRRPQKWAPGHRNT